MKIKSALSLLAAASLALSSAAFAAGAKTYEVTGPVLEVNDSMIVVQKGKDRWEINRDANTKVTGDVKVGDKVHVTYTMSATDVEVKAGKGAKKDKKKRRLRRRHKLRTTQIAGCASRVRRFCCSHVAVRRPDASCISSAVRDRRYRIRRLTQTPLQSSPSAAAAEDSAKQAASDLPTELAARGAHRALGH